MFGSLKSLWIRVPLWRFFVMSGVLLTILFVLYPPNLGDGYEKSTISAIGTASYSQQAQAVPQAVSPQTSAVATISAKPNGISPSSPAGEVYAPRSAMNTTVALHAKQKRETGNTTAAATPATNSLPITSIPKTAELSMVTADTTAKPNDVGIDKAILGRLYTGSIQVDGFKLPLPSGNWVKLSTTTVNAPTATGVGFFFGKIEHKRLVAAIKGYVMRSKDNPGAGFPEAKGCTKADPTRNFVLIEEVTPFDNEACWFIHSYFTPPWQQWADRSVKIDAIDRAAAGDMAAKGVTYPQDFVEVHFIRSAKWGGMEVHYLFSPEAEGITSNTVLSYADMDWRANNIVHHPEKIAYVDKLKAWGMMFWPQFKASFAEAEPVADVK